MIRHIIHRLLAGLVTVWLAATLAFLALSVLPGDAIESQLVQSGIDSAEIEQRRAALGLADNLSDRYLRFLQHLVQSDLGASLLSGEPVIEVVARNILPTVTLALGALLTATLLGISLGIINALAKGPVSLLAGLGLSLALSTPIYWTGTIAIYVFTVQLRLLPSAGAGRLGQLILPVSVLGFHTAAAIGRVVKNNVIETMDAPYIQTARAKGLPERQIIVSHGLRAALLPVVGVIALQAGFLLSGTVITESLFVRPGIGRLMLDATIQQDYPVVLGIVILAAVVYTLLNIVGDIVRHILDPRVRA